MAVERAGSKYTPEPIDGEPEKNGLILTRAMGQSFVFDNEIVMTYLGESTLNGVREGALIEFSELADQVDPRKVETHFYELGKWHRIGRTKIAVKVAERSQSDSGLRFFFKIPQETRVKRESLLDDEVVSLRFSRKWLDLDYNRQRISR